MGKILIIFKLLPEGPEEAEKVEKEIKEKLEGTAEVKEIRKEPIGFGLSAIKVAVVIPDKVDGLNDKVEGKLREIPGVSEVEVEGTTLI